MNKKPYIHFSCILLICILALAGIFLPERISNHFDQSAFNKVRSTPVEPFTIEASKVETFLLDKLRLLSDYPNKVTAIPLKAGVHFDAKSAKQNFYKEVDTLHEIGLLPIKIDSKKKKLKIDASVEWLVQNDAPSTNVVLWTILVQADDFTGGFRFDDETGKILDCYMIIEESMGDVGGEAANQWADYLGLEVKNIHLEPDIFYEYNTLDSDGTNDSKTSLNNQLTVHKSGLDRKLLSFYKSKDLRCDIYQMDLSFDDGTLPYKAYILENGFVFGNITESFESNLFKIKVLY